jgi:thiol:disulfide interchange protein DsbD
VLLVAVCLVGCRRAGREEEKKPDLPPSSAVMGVDREWLTPGESAELGVFITLQPGWHTYADPPGDSGMAPAVVLKVSEGITVGSPQLPRHQTFKDAAGTTFGYEKAVLIRVPLTLARDVPAGVAALDVNVDYLVCRDACVAQHAGVKLSIPIRAERAPLTKMWEKALKRGGWDQQDN